MVFELKVYIVHLEDQSFGVLIDGNSSFTIIHFRKVLDGAADADGNIEIGQNYLITSLADVVLLNVEN